MIAHADIPYAAMKQQAQVLASTAIYLAADVPEARPPARVIGPGVVQVKHRAYEEGRRRPRTIPGWRWRCAITERLAVCDAQVVGSFFVANVNYRAGKTASITTVTLRQGAVRARSAR